MNEKQAREAGYEYTGNYSHDKEEMKLAAKKLREQSNKAIVVNVPPSKLSRGHHGMGYSVYWIESEENKSNRAKEEKKSLIHRLEFEKENLLCKIAQINDQIAFITKEI